MHELTPYWKDRIQIHEISFQKFIEISIAKYDLIVSNPPFFSNGIKAPDETRAKARHSYTLPLSTLISGAKGLLSDNGRIALILPIESHREIEILTKINELNISRLCRVKPNPVKPDFRILFEISKSESPFEEKSLMIEFEKHHDYTLEYKHLTKDFYLKF